MNKDVVIIADYREKTWDDYIQRGVMSMPYPRNKRLKLELQLEDRYMDFLDLVNYSICKDNPNARGRFVSMDNYVTLNGLFLADYLRKQNFGVSLIRNFVSQKERLKDLIQAQPLAVIVSTTFMTLFTLKGIVKFLRTYCSKNTAIIIGGPTIFETKAYDPSRFIDLKQECRGTLFVLEKQGEKSLLKLLNDLASSTFDVDSSCNIMMLDEGGEFKFSPRKEEENSLDDNIIDWESLPEDFLDSVVSMRTSRGCPCRCAFCTFWMLHPKHLFKSISNIRKELEGIKKRPLVKHLMFADDVINISKERMKSICQLMIDAELSISWSANLKVVPIDEEIVELMKRSNCKLVFIGFESFDDQILKNMNKGIMFKDQMRCIKLLKSAGIGILGSFVFGFPGETKETLKRTIGLINETGIDFSELNPFFYFPYSPVGKKRDEFRLQGGLLDWSHYTMTSKELDSMLPDELAHIGPSLGLYDWCIWSQIALLLSKGLDIPEIKEIFAIRRGFIKTQNDGLSISEEMLLKQTRRINDMVMRVGGE